MNGKVLIGILLALLLLGAIFIYSQRESEGDSGPAPSNTEKNEIEDDLTQDHLDEAFADLEFVESNFVS